MSTEAERLYYTEPRFKNLIEMLFAHILDGSFTAEELELAVGVVFDKMQDYKAHYPDWVPLTLEQRQARDKAALLNAMININRPPIIIPKALAEQLGMLERELNK